MRNAGYLLIAMAAFGANGNAAMASEANRLTVVELFQSQGCSSCPPANANVMKLSDRPDVLTLSFQVTYWDKLGWKDTFGSKANTERQWDYARAFHRTNVFTPEVVVNGTADAVGVDSNELDGLVHKAQASKETVPLTIANNTVRIGDGDGGARPAQVWLVRYNPNIVQVPIARGENSGRTLPHKNVVMELRELGEWTGRSQTFDLPPASQSGLRDAVLVQDGKGGAILAAARVVS